MTETRLALDEQAQAFEHTRAAYAEERRQFYDALAYWLDHPRLTYRDTSRGDTSAETPELLVHPCCGWIFQHADTCGAPGA